MKLSYFFFLLFYSTVQLADAVKRGACSLGSSQPDSQVMVINAVKDVAAALGELINATKLASGKSIHDPAMQDLKESARVSLNNFEFFFLDNWITGKIVTLTLNKKKYTNIPYKLYQALWFFFF